MAVYACREGIWKIIRYAIIGGIRLKTLVLLPIVLRQSHNLLFTLTAGVFDFLPLRGRGIDNCGDREDDNRSRILDPGFE